jgi:hypothetical protein
MRWCGSGAQRKADIARQQHVASQRRVRSRRSSSVRRVRPDWGRAWHRVDIGSAPHLHDGRKNAVAGVRGASITAAYQFENASRLGLQLGHISNPHIHEDNPGEEDAFITYALPF